MTGRLYRPETPREQVLQDKLNKLFEEASHPPGRLKVPQPTRWERMLAALRRLVGH